MKVGIGLPNAVRGVDRAAIVDWAREADQAGFSSLGTIDRIVYPNYESLIALAAAAAVTERIRLLTDILIAPLRANTALFAKQAATIDALSGGRLTLGLAVGGREDDFSSSGLDFHARGRTFDSQLGEVTSIWKGERGIGPAPANGRPELLIGGSSDATFKRVAKFGDGWTQGGGTPDALAQGRQRANAAWSEAGRDGQPRTMALFYFVLGEDPERTAQENLGDYYAWLGGYADQIVASAAKHPDTIKQYLSGFESAGADEVICFPASTDVGQVELLADAVLR